MRRWFAVNGLDTSRGKAFLVCVAVSGMIALPLAAGEGQSQNLVLENDRLSVLFAPSPAGPRLQRIEDKVSRRAYMLEGAEEVGLVVIEPQKTQDPALEILWEFPEDMEYTTAKLSEDKSELTIGFRHRLVDVEVGYRLQSDAAVLRKSITCRATKGGAYIAGVTHWKFEPPAPGRVWPPNSTIAQPIVIADDRGGFFATLQWPTATAEVQRDSLCLSYRPGFLLEPAQAKGVSVGSLGFFQPQYPGQNALEAAREAFFDHVRHVVEPNVPFPIKFTTWGPWRGQATAERIMRIMDDLAYVGTDLLHFDAGWENQDHPTGVRTDYARTMKDDVWDSCMTEPMRLPHGLRPLVAAARQRNMRLSLWFDACGNVFTRESETWAVIGEDGKPVYSPMWIGPGEQAPLQSLATEYGDRLEEKVLQALERYDLGGIMFDNQSYTMDFGKDRRSLANGWNSVDVQLRQIIEIFDEVNRRRPGIYRFFCRGAAWPWALQHATHIHAGDPFVSPQGDYSARAVALSRLRAWRSHYTNFVPPWGIKGDIAGWSEQQNSPIPVNLEHTGQLIPAGEGWTQNMFMCFATTAVRDIRFSFEQMPQYDKDVLKEWLAWDRRRARFIFNCRPIVLGDNNKPNEGMDVFSHVRSGKGVLYIFNRSFDLVQTDIKLDEKAGIKPSDRLSAYMVYPMKASLGTLVFDQSLHVPVIGKDCIVIEVGLEEPAGARPFSDYERDADRVCRSFEPVYHVSAERLLDVGTNRTVRLQIGDSPRDRRLARQLMDTLSAAAGTRIDTAQWERTPVSQADYRLVMGTSEGLHADPAIGKCFADTLYDKYVDWEGRLYSAPIVVESKANGIPTIYVIAPRPEQLAQLCMDMTDRLIARYKETMTLAFPRSDLFTVPLDDPLLRFEPTMSYIPHAPLPGTLEPVDFEITVETNGKMIPVWREEIPPFCSAHDAKWWKDRVVSLREFAGQDIRVTATAKHRNGPGHPNLLLGYAHVAVLEKKQEAQ